MFSFHLNSEIVLFDSTAYAYLYNLQGDVVALVDGTARRLLSIAMIPGESRQARQGRWRGHWGPCSRSGIGGYVWDEETGLYYLRSRYYRPSWGRFVTADAICN